LSRVPAL